MKKLAALMTAAMVMTVGGVYATWSYATQDITSEATSSTLVGLTGVGTTTQKGTLAVLIAKDTTITVDQDADNESDIHTAQLVFTGNPVASFTPAKGASVSGGKMLIKISLDCARSSYTKYDQVTTINDLFYLEGANDEGIVEYTVNSDVDNDSALAGQQVTIDLSQYLKMKSLVLGTIEDHTHFGNWLKTNPVEVIITVSEQTA